MDNVIEKGEKYLPLGTVVMLKGGSKRAMITGFCSVAEEEKAKVYDYSGCIFPEGYLSSNQICLFNHDQIETIYHKGLVDDEEIEFKKKLNELTKMIDNELIENMLADSEDDEEDDDEIVINIEDEEDDDEEKLENL